jgi:hypothetical protein
MVNRIALLELEEEKIKKKIELTKNKAISILKCKD